MIIFSNILRISFRKTGPSNYNKLLAPPTAQKSYSLTETCRTGIFGRIPGTASQRLLHPDASSSGLSPFCGCCCFCCRRRSSCWRWRRCLRPLRAGTSDRERYEFSSYIVINERFCRLALRLMIAFDLSPCDSDASTVKAIILWYIVVAF